MTKRDHTVVENTYSHVKKKIMDSLIRGFNHELISIMVNKGRIHKELGKCFRCLQNLIKLNNELE